MYDSLDWSNDDQIIGIGRLDASTSTIADINDEKG
jgi:hypothetical protein